MANVYTNYKAVLSNSALTTLYTVPSETTAIIKSIRVSNVDAQNDCKISIYLVDSSSVSYNLQTDRAVQSLTTEELLAAGSLVQDSADSSVGSPCPLVAKESEVIKVQAENGGDLHVILSVLEIS
jgi:hypothetical protein|tara:strand:+ start:101 stop:475 length:375 start_codon:yes stop_codon:yes gene_type:complete